VPDSDGILGLFLFLASVIAGYSLLGGFGALLGAGAGIYLASEVVS
jgi:hypothetical protein